MTIRQVQLAYEQEHDRLLLRLATTDRNEFRFWLTRRMVKRLWGVLSQMLEWDAAVAHADAAARAAILAFQHDKHAGQADFKQPFSGDAAHFPLGPEPVLVGKVVAQRKEGGFATLSLLPMRGQGIDIALDPRLLHLMVRLLRQAVGRSDWDLPLPGPAALVSAAADAPHTLN